MPVPYGYGETVRLGRRRPSGDFDAYGAMVYATTETVLTGCAVWPTSTSETLQNQDRTNSNWTVAVPPGTNTDAVDYVLWQGKKYEVSGERQTYRNPMTGTVSPEVINVTRVEG